MEKWRDETYIKFDKQPINDDLMALARKCAGALHPAWTVASRESDAKIIYDTFKGWEAK